MWRDFFTTCFWGFVSGDLSYCLFLVFTLPLIIWRPNTFCTCSSFLVLRYLGVFKQGKVVGPGHGLQGRRESGTGKEGVPYFILLVIYSVFTALFFTCTFGFVFTFWSPSFLFVRTQGLGEASQYGESYFFLFPTELSQTQMSRRIAPRQVLDYFGVASCLVRGYGMRSLVLRLLFLLTKLFCWSSR